MAQDAKTLPNFIKGLRQLTVCVSQFLFTKMSLRKLKTTVEVCKLLMQDAVKAVKDAGMSENGAAKHFKVQRMTLRRRLQDLHTKRSGGQLKFSEEVEKDLAEFLVSCSDEGVPLNRAHCMRLFSQVAIELGKLLLTC